MPKENSTLIVMVLDRSGSMEVVRNDTVGGFNTFLGEQQKNNQGDTLITLAQFDHEYELLYNAVPINEVKPLTRETYVPRGMTALLDALGRTINDVGAKLAALNEEDRPSKVIFVVITDGQENASKELNRLKIKEMIEHQTSKYSWEFVYLGANQDSFTEAANYGVSSQSTMNYANTSEGILRAYSTLSRAVSDTANNVTASVQFTEEDRALNDPTSQVSSTPTL